ncbi:tubulointerstitial nephritis antigen-like [Cylas formicarius]|uniref:tubulointerstitial nephritis antigen-like n=1 Tax=Cylas formicarius TaxID=197179 RepID=UPI0029589080|nr:tubulointerstitial nephritis antigen-like [Cylas formicarius]
MITRVRWTFIFLLVYVTIASLQPVDDFSDIMGPFCVNIGCCNNRIDSCSEPIRGTLCYCDEFCNRTDVHDCCPDYWSFCHGIYITTPLPPPTTRRPEPPPEIRACLYNDRTWPVNGTVRENCNECKCVDVGYTVEMMCEKNICLVDEAIINTVNNREVHYGWTAANYSKFWGRTLDDGIRYRLGTLQPQKAVLGMHSMKRIYDPSALPKEFNTETRWPRYISGIRDQGWCGSSWAISTAAVASDRYGIVSKGLEEVQLSAQNIISCETKDKGCEGGRYDRAWNFVRKFGLVDENCFPYVGNTTSCRIRRFGDLATAGCTAPRYSERTGRYKVGPSYKLGNETDIMYEMMRSGPVQATMKVYHDFFSYSNGVYRHTDLTLARKQGFHSVRIVGWGEEYTASGLQKYWKVANSWGTDWGENGYFRILRGSNECDIESYVLGVWPEVDRKILTASPLWTRS